jgi:hypothetical protein
LKDVIAVTDKDRQIELSMSFFASWKDPRIYRRNNSSERINLKNNKDEIFLPDFYIYSLIELQKTQMFLGLSENLLLDENNSML